MVEKDLGPPVRYTSYHSDKTFSILDKAQHRIKHNTCFVFEYNGLEYHISTIHRNQLKANELWHLHTTRMPIYLMPDAGSDSEAPNFLTEFNGENFDEFIETFEIEGKTVKWVLEHQKEWKYSFSAKHLEKVLTGYSFWFIYRQMPCGIYTSGKEKRTVDGRYITIWPCNMFDVTQYAPTIPGAEQWFHAQNRLGIFSWPKEVTQMVETIQIGPFKTDAALLDTVHLNNKTLREIFDTEYDDGAVCCGMFDG